MRVPQDERFRQEREKFALRFNCEDCCHFVEASAKCLHGYPTDGHRAARYDDPTAELLFCKDFTLL
jgi:hypothetical protein